MRIWLLLLITFGTPVAAAAQPCDPYASSGIRSAVDLAGVFGDGLVDPAMLRAPNAVSPQGQREFREFRDSLEFGDVSYDPATHMFWVTNEKAIGKLLVDAPLSDVSPVLHEATLRALHHFGIDADPYLSISDIPGEIADELEDRFRDRVPKTVVVGAHAAWILTQGGRIRVFKTRLGRRPDTEFRLYYHHDPDVEASDVEARIRTRFDSGAHMNLSGRRDAIRFDYVQPLDFGVESDWRISADHSSGDSSVYLKFQMRW